MALINRLGKVARSSSRGITRPAGGLGFLSGIGASMGGTAALAGVGGALAGSNLLFGDENTYGMQQALFEGVLGDPYADVTLTGKHLNMWDHAIKPAIIPDLPGFGALDNFNRHARALGHVNGQSIENFQADRRVDRYRFNNEDTGTFDFYNAGDRLQAAVQGVVEGGSYDYAPISTHSNYRPRGRNQAHDPAMGNIVFGAYNTRHGR